MEISISEIQKGITVLEPGATLSGDGKVQGEIEMDIENQPIFIQTVDKLLNDNKNKIIVNMQNISYIDSSGLWALFEGHKKTEQNNGKLVLLNPHPDVKRVLDITKMSKKIDIFSEEKKAIESFK